MLLSAAYHPRTITPDGVEARPHRIKRCMIPGCDHQLVTSWYVGSPGRTEPTDLTVLDRAAAAHLWDAHGDRDARRALTRFT